MFALRAPFQYGSFFFSHHFRSSFWLANLFRPPFLLIIFARPPFLLPISTFHFPSSFLSGRFSHCFCKSFSPIDFALQHFLSLFSLSLCSISVFTQHSCLRPLQLYERSTIDSSGGPVHVLHGNLLVGVFSPRHRPFAGGVAWRGGRGGFGKWTWERDRQGVASSRGGVLWRVPGSLPAGCSVEALSRLSNGD